MKLNHINLTVTDVSAAREFLETYFGLQTKSTHDDSFAVLLDEDGLLLALMKGTQVNYPKTFHIGFSQKNEEQVNDIYLHLKNDGFDVKPPKRAHRWTFYVKAPGGFTIEVFC
ncbi:MULTISPECIES: VOC family protein [Neobacillus]|uniref:VOC family protein n=1 Tax=Neobacillus rhizophilus TaxID=2833579 RepID=A0A942YWH0_9BACI|nr:MULTISPECIES: VOC family protein [Neobacillus]MBS4214035.1 VOC family protein [Neobacillus rhizophilus]MBU8917562.1 VOC family protein [Bacillus sp. FJAT-29953]